MLRFGLNKTTLMSLFSLKVGCLILLRMKTLQLMARMVSGLTGKVSQKKAWFQFCEKMPFSLKSISRPKCFEYLALNVCLGSTANCDNLFLIGAYCLPSAKSGAIEKLFKLIYAQEKSEILLLGDLNLNFLTDVSNTNLCNNLNSTYKNLDTFLLNTVNQCSYKA